VGATTRANAHSIFSRVGPDVDVVAPGGSTAPGTADADDILSTVPYYFWPFTGCNTNPDCSGYQAGTSQAAPQVAGIAAMLDSRGLSNAQIRARIQSTATNLGPAGRDNTFGHGLVNARAALAPTGSVKINGGAAATRTLAVRLSLNATDAGGAGVAQMCVSNTTRCTAWRAYTTSLSWRLSAGGAGTRSVYVRFKDRAGVTSAAYRDTIRYAP
jgi:subtilisin family serine protease